MTATEKHEIRVKAILGRPLTARERAAFLLFIADEQQAKEFLKREKEQGKCKK